MDRLTRTDLLREIETQKDQIERYENRLRDVVRAYKGIVKEKEALESSIKVLSSSQSRHKHVKTGSVAPPTSSTGNKDQGAESKAEDSSSDQEFNDPLNLQQSTESTESDEETLVEDKMQTLSNSLLTLTEEKSKLEQSYIADKKRMKQENEELQRVCEELREKLSGQEKDLNEQLQELKSKVRAQQIERETEQTDHAVMLRELQKILAKQREGKELLEQQLDECQFNLKEKEQQTIDITAKYNQLSKDRQKQLDEAKVALKTVEEKSKKPSPVILDLRKEAKELKAKHLEEIEREETKLQVAEDKVIATSEQSEKRISELESKLSDLSELIGNYERLRYQDQQTLLRMKDKVSQLEMENSALVEITDKYQRQTCDSTDNLDAMEIAARIMTLKDQLNVTNSQSEKPVCIEDLLFNSGDSLDNPLSQRYREELEQVKDEFERYKLRAQSVLKNKKDATSTKEADILKDQLNHVRERFKSLQIQQKDEEEHAKQREENLRKTLISLKEKHKQEVQHLQGEHNTQLQDLEDEIKKQRERTVSLLAEKDNEIEVFRATSSRRLDSDYIMRYRTNQDVIGGASSERETSEEEAMARLLNVPPGGKGDVTMLYFAQEQARKDVDIGTLRKQKRELEASLREMQFSSGTEQENFVDEINKLKEDNSRLKRNISREDANLEYLKNVTYKFLICNDAHGKQQMLNAITTILQFSPQEKSSVQFHTRSWWTSS